MARRPDKVQRAWQPERVAFERERRDTDFDYNGRKWRKVRKSFLEKNSVCCDCDVLGLTVLATVADHEPRAKVLIARGDDPYDERWLMARCKKHHDSKSGREAHS